MNNFEIDKRIEDTIRSMADAGMPMKEQDISDLIRALNGEISFEDLIQPLINNMIKEGPNIDVLHDDSDEAHAELDRRFREGLRIMFEEKRRLGLPVARYDKEKKESYLEWPWGRKEYV